MHAFTVENNAIVSVLRTKVGVGVAFDPKKSSPPNFVEFDAIWDTGASASVISKNVVLACNLQPTGMLKVYTASGESLVNSYLVSFMLPNKVGFQSVKVSEGKLNGTEVLIGMDIICQGDFAVSNSKGKTVFTFRMPSIATTDYVDEAKKIDRHLIGKVGRNALCPCGSGKKYKKCCLS